MLSSGMRCVDKSFTSSKAVSLGVKMSDEINRPLIVFGVDITHSRLVDLAKLADQAEPFYIWVEEQFQSVLNRSEPFDTLLRESSEDDIRRAIQACYNASSQTNLPLLFDGIG